MALYFNSSRSTRLLSPSQYHLRNMSVHKASRIVERLGRPTFSRISRPAC